ncbi:MAG: A/G-specific adenine glycosylase [Planctomycetes bacterium]|nr:A/G-specific adenine glycosylase [Planctomycetota bacterium]
MSRATVARLGRLLVRWYRTHARDLPWRRTRDPYRIWVSEVMLQQTRVKAVVPYYGRFLERFPTLEALAGSSEEALMAVWQGLGYYGRARRLQEAAREVRARYGGRLPAEPEGLARLPGMGAYTAGAVASIAFGAEVPAVDGNVARVIARLHALEGPVGSAAERRAVAARAAALIPRGQAGALNQALMELGATVCLPRRPRCDLCPLGGDCRARALGATGRIPEPARRATPRRVPAAFAVVHRGGRLALARRAPRGLLAGLWLFPGLEGAGEPGPLEGHLRAAHGLDVRLEGPVLEFRHAFSHRRWEASVYGGRLAAGQGPRRCRGLVWVRRSELDRHAIPSAHRPILEWLRASQRGFRA